MSTGKGGSDESRRDGTDKARQTVGLKVAARRMWAGVSGAIATMHGKVSSGSLGALVQARIPPAWRRPRRLILIGALLVAIVLIIVTAPATLQHRPAPGTTVFQVGNRVVLRFVHSAGSVHLTPGKNGQVSITEHRYGMTDAIRTGYRQQGDVITADASVENGLPVATWVDFNVVAPQDTNVNVTVPAGTLSVAGLAGTFALQDTNGSVSATYVSGALALRTTSGSISTSQVNGQVSAITDNGTITASETHLHGHSLVQAQNGTINFHGSLDPGSQAVFRNTNGAIGATLPSRSSVLVDARTPHGSINSQFPSVRVGTNSDGRIADGRLGRGTPARLRIRTMGGSISLYRSP
jgi:hypothetical protein